MGEHKLGSSIDQYFNVTVTSADHAGLHQINITRFAMMVNYIIYYDLSVPSKFSMILVVTITITSQYII